MMMIAHVHLHFTLLMPFIAVMTSRFIWSPSPAQCGDCLCFWHETEFSARLSKFANCSSRNLNEVPQTLPDDVQIIDLSRNHLPNDAIRQIGVYRALRGLDLSNNGLTDLPPGTFKEMSHLAYLSLTGNAFAEIRSSSLAGLRSLRLLKGLSTFTIWDSAFQDLNRLRDLEITIRSSVLPHYFFKNIKLTELDLVLVNAFAIPGDLFKFGDDSLEIFNLSVESMKEVPENLLAHFEMLKKFRLRAPQVDMLNETIFGTCNLEKTDSQCKTSSTMLSNIQLSGPQRLSPSLFQSQQRLQSVSLSNIGSISTDILQNQTSLKYLQITESNITDLNNKSFHGLSSLAYLDLSNNNLHSLAGELFAPVGRTLENLTLSGNGLSQLDVHTFDGILTLKYLDLSNNSLTCLHDHQFSSLARLHTLNLNDNQVTDVGLPVKLFYPLRDLATIKFSRNNVTHFPTNLFKQNPALHSLDMEGNAIKCDCSLIYAIQHNHIALSGTCTMPGNFTIMTFLELSESTECRNGGDPHELHLIYEYETIELLDEEMTPTTCIYEMWSPSFIAQTANFEYFLASETMERNNPSDKNIGSQYYMSSSTKQMDLLSSRLDHLKSVDVADKSKSIFSASEVFGTSHLTSSREEESLHSMSIKELYPEHVKEIESHETQGSVPESSSIQQGKSYRNSEFTPKLSIKLQIKVIQGQKPGISTSDEVHESIKQSNGRHNIYSSTSSYHQSETTFQNASQLLANKHWYNTLPQTEVNWHEKESVLTPMDTNNHHQQITSLIYSRNAKHSPTSRMSHQDDNLFTARAFQAQSESSVPYNSISSTPNHLQNTISIGTTMTSQPLSGRITLVFRVCVGVICVFLGSISIIVIIKMIRERHTQVQFYALEQETEDCSVIEDICQYPGMTLSKLDVKDNEEILDFTLVELS